METADTILTQLLEAGASSSQTEIREAYGEWKAGKHKQEGFLEFLVRHRRLVPELLVCGYLLDSRRVSVSDSRLLIRNWNELPERLLSECFQPAPRSADARESPFSLWSGYPLPSLAFGNSIKLRPAHTPDEPSNWRHDTTHRAQVEPVVSDSAKDEQLAEDAFWSAMPKVGDTLGRCLLTGRLGRGGSGLVYSALHKKLQIPVAVKLLMPGDPEEAHHLREVLRHEASLLARLNHPNVVRVYDVEDEGLFPYLVMESVEGMSLAELVEQSGRVEPDRAVRIIRQAAAGLAAAARVGIIHRDVKPGNILLAKDGTAKIADLGLALVHSSGASPRQGEGARKLSGTVLYMSPEQATCRPDIDHRSDIYSLGATLYHVLSGRPPFAGRRASEILLKQMNEKPPSLREFMPDLPPRLEDVVQRMLAKAPQHRFDTYEQLIEALAEFDRGVVFDKQGHSTQAGEATSTMSQSGRKRWRTLTALFGRKTDS